LSVLGICIYIYIYFELFKIFLKRFLFFFFFFFFFFLLLLLLLDLQSRFSTADYSYLGSRGTFLGGKAAGA
jgi:hypothetical protein